MPRRETVWILATAFVVFTGDILTKFLALHCLRVFEPLSVVPGFFNLSLVFNRGAAFGMFPSGAPVYTILAAVTVAAIFVFSATARNIPLLLKIALGLVCGGAAGNLVDRLRFGYVVDFLDCYVGNLHWPAFNVADSALCIGSFLLMVHVLRTHKTKDPQ